MTEKSIVSASIEDMGFAKPPYRAELVNPSWACVFNADGVNCLRFPDKPGAKFTSLEHAKRIAEEWNAKTQVMPKPL